MDGINPTLAFAALLFGLPGNPQDTTHHSAMKLKSKSRRLCALTRTLAIRRSCLETPIRSCGRPFPPARRRMADRPCEPSAAHTTFAMTAAQRCASSAWWAFAISIMLVKRN